MIGVIAQGTDSADRAGKRMNEPVALGQQRPN